MAKLHLDHAALERAFARHIGRRISVVASKRTPVGLSRETWFLKVKDERGEMGRYVLRRDLPHGSFCPAPLRFEYEMYRRLKTVLPVPEALWYHDDPDDLVDKRDCYLRGFVEGSAEVEEFSDQSPQFNGLRIGMAVEHAKALARVHLVDWRGLGLQDLIEAPASPDQTALYAIERIERQLLLGGREPLPFVQTALEWLRAHAPAASAPICLIKGSNGYSQEIFAGGRLVAMADWELASLGHPAYDWARCSGFMFRIPQVWDERMLLDEYEKHSGYRILKEDLSFYRILFRVDMFAAAHCATASFEQGHYDARIAYLATGLARSSLEYVARKIGRH